MKTIMMDIDAIRPYEKNPRKNDGAIDKVARSIQEFGFNQPIVVDKNHVIIVGHTRYLAARKIGLEKIPVYVAKELDETKARAYRIADNKLHEFSWWDHHLLADELIALKDADFDLSVTGFEQFDAGNNDDSSAGGQETKSRKDEYLLIIECKDEQDQIDKMQKIEAIGITCKPLIS